MKVRISSCGLRIAFSAGETNTSTAIIVTLKTGSNEILCSDWIR
jgi:hypothetical protein